MNRFKNSEHYQPKSKPNISCQWIQAIQANNPVEYQKGFAWCLFMHSFQQLISGFLYDVDVDVKSLFERSLAFNFEVSKHISKNPNFIRWKASKQIQTNIWHLLFIFGNEEFKSKSQHLIGIGGIDYRHTDSNRWKSIMFYHIYLEFLIWIDNFPISVPFSVNVKQKVVTNRDGRTKIEIFSVFLEIFTGKYSFILQDLRRVDVISLRTDGRTNFSPFPPIYRTKLACNR